MKIADFLVLDRPHPIGSGRQQIYRFPNNYGASVVRTPLTHNSKDSYEVAVLRFNGDDWTLDYTTPITDDVLGWIGEGEQLEHLLTQISEL